MACVLHFPSMRLFLCLSRSACSQAFESATNFNADISEWNTASVTTMLCVFYHTSQREREIRAPPHTAHTPSLFAPSTMDVAGCGEGGAAACGVRASLPGRAGKEY